MRGQTLIGAALLAAAQGAPVSAQQLSPAISLGGDRPASLHGGVCGIINIPGSRGSWVDRLWPGGVVPYEFAPGITGSEQTNFQGGLNSVAAACGVRFIERTDEGDYILITRSPDAGVSYSQVGRVGGAQQLQIADTHWGWNDLVAHELMHALGLWHEQQRPDRDDFILVNSANIAAGAVGNFNYAGQAHGPYDFESVMHYSSCAFSTCGPCSPTDPGCRTMTALPPYESFQSVMGDWNGLSDGDRAVLTMLYGPALRPINDNRSGDVLVRIGSSDAVQDSYNVDPSDEYDPIDRALSVTDSQGMDETGTASVITRSTYGGYDEASDRFNTIEFVTQIRASLFVGFEEGEVSASENISMGFSIDHLDPGETVELVFAASVKASALVQGSVETSYVRLTGPGLDIFVDTEYSHVLKLGNGEYTLRGVGSVAFGSAFGDFGGEGSIDLAATLGRPGDVVTPDVIAGPFERDGKGYYLLDNATWEQAQLKGLSCLGGDLVTVNDSSENTWLRSNVTEFDGVQRHVWIGYTDRYSEGLYAWTAGDANSYEAWLPGEPNGAAAQNYAGVFRGSSGWFDAQNDWNVNFAPVHGIVEVDLPGVHAGPFYYNGNTYYLLEDANWQRSRAAAMAMGGDLVTVNDAAENLWLRDTLSNSESPSLHLWLGLSDKGREGEHAWADGDPAGFRKWLPGEPDGGVRENFVALWNGTDLWFDATHDWNERFAPVHGVVEIPGVPPCSGSDLAEPYGVLDFTDVIAFLSAFGAMGPEADLAEPIGTFNFSDVIAFLTAFGAGCP